MCNIQIFQDFQPDLRKLHSVLKHVADLQLQSSQNSFIPLVR